MEPATLPVDPHSNVLAVRTQMACTNNISTVRFSSAKILQETSSASSTKVTDTEKQQQCNHQQQPEKQKSKLSPAANNFKVCRPMCAPMLMNSKASGGILFAKHQGQILLLLGSEIRKKRLVWGTFGGKLEHEDKTAQDTAAREIEEESLGLFPRDSLHEQLGRSPQYWITGGKYVLFLVEIPFNQQLPFLFQQIRKTQKTTLSHQQQIAWVHWSSVKNIKTAEDTFTLPGIMEPQRLWEFFSRSILCSEVRRFLNEVLFIAHSFRCL